MGGIVAAETLVSIARDEPVPTSRHANDTTNATTTETGPSKSKPVNLPVPEQAERASSAPPASEPTTLFFPYIQAVLAFDTPYLGISPGVLAHGAEVQLGHATTAYKAYDSATQLFGWGSSRGGAAAAAPNASTGSAAAFPDVYGWQKWGTYAMYGGAAAAIAGIAGAAYLNWNQINQGFEWAGSHLEFVGCLARGGELKKRVETVVDLTRTRHIGFANFYGALGEKVTGQTKYAGAVLGADRTFCVIPRDAADASATGGRSPPGSKRSASGTGATDPPPTKRRPHPTSKDPRVNAQMEEGNKVQDFAEDASKPKGHWVRCVNEKAADEISAHQAMFAPDANPDYFDMLTRARDQVVEWVEGPWYEESERKVTAVDEEGDDQGRQGPQFDVPFDLD
jgi:hypothetical protein